MKKRFLRAAGILAGLAIFAALIHFAGFQKLIGIFEKANPVSMVFALFIYASSWIFRTQRLKRLTDSSGRKIRLMDLFKLHISGYALNAVLPAKMGDMATVGYLKLKGIRIGRSAAIVLQTRLLDLTALIVLCLPSLLILSGNTSPLWFVSSLALSAGIVTLCVVTVILDKKHKLANVFVILTEKSRKGIIRLIGQKLSQAYIGYHQMVSNKKLLGFTLALSLLIWLLDGLACAAVYFAMSGRLSIFPCFFAVAVGNMAKSVPFTPGGIGLYESAVAAGLVLSGVSLELAAAVGIADHILKKAFNILVGFLATSSMDLKWDQVKGLAAQIKLADGRKGLGPDHG